MPVPEKNHRSIPLRTLKILCIPDMFNPHCGCFYFQGHKFSVFAFLVLHWDFESTIVSITNSYLSKLLKLTISRFFFFSWIWGISEISKNKKTVQLNEFTVLNLNLSCLINTGIGLVRGVELGHPVISYLAGNNFSQANLNPDSISHWNSPKT